MNKLFLLPKLALTGIRKSGVIYLPYIFTTAFSIGIFFIFSCIIGNPILDNVPHAGYVVMLLAIGKGLLVFILILFLFYTNSFLIKQRKKELGLYTILGLEKKHVGLIVLFETLILYIVSIIIGIATACVFAKLIFLFMLRISGLPSDTGFVLTPVSFTSTITFFGAVSLINLITNLWQVTRVNPTELLQGSKKGEKEPKHLWIPTVFGLLTLAIGYGSAITSKLDSMIFVRFPVAVLFVIIGTYLLFTSGITALLKLLKKNKRFYYTKDNYVTISGMFYRMKKSVASLVNICIFSTMVIITLLCTVALTLGEKDAIRYSNPTDVSYSFPAVDEAIQTDFTESIATLSNQYQVTTEPLYIYTKKSTTLMPADDTHFVTDTTSGFQGKEIDIILMTLDDYNQIMNQSETLNDGEALCFSTTEDYGHSTFSYFDTTFSIKKELSSLCIESKEPHGYSNRAYYLIVKDMGVLNALPGSTPSYSFAFNMTGEKENQQAFVNALEEKANSISHTYDIYFSSRNILDYSAEMKSMNGGLLFIGVFFGLIFSISLILIMYYKQISEGLEDQNSFHIMKKVGMSEEDVKKTIQKQILLVFSIPLVVAIIHTFASINMTIQMLYALNLYNTSTILISAVIIIIAFTIFYGISYKITAKTYYRIIS